MEAKFTIPGRAIPKARPRVTRAGYAYTPRTTQQFEQLVRIAYKNQCGNFEFPKGAPLLMNIEFCFEPPKSWPKQKREKAIQRKKYPTARPDLDNLWKAVADVLYNKYDFNFSWNMFVKCSDLDKRCVHMSYLQLGLAGIPAEIEWADSMTGQVMEKWRTPTMMMFWERFERYSR